MNGSSIVLQFDNLSFTYAGSQRRALDGVSFSIAEGEKVALLGLNGSGKTTMLLLAAGLMEATSGEIRLAGRCLDSRNASDAWRVAGMLFQNSDDQLFMPSVEEDVAFGPANMGLTRDETAGRVDRALQLVGCEELRHRQPSHLSGGEKRMVSLATVLAMEPRLMLFDEPTSMLDIAARRRFVEVTAGLPAAMLMSTHDPELARKLCPRALLVDHGRIIADGPTDSICRLLESV